VRHPRVVDDIETDMEILRCLADWSKFVPGHLGDQIRWLDPMGAVEGFAKILTGQLDFRSEAINLERFNKNFADDKDVIFPEV
jgi:ubiquinone biosynthesis protein